MINTEHEILLLIVMDDTAEEQRKRKKINDIEGQFGKKKIRLYKIENKVPKEQGGSGEKYAVALPLESGNVLFLSKHEKKDCFVCDRIKFYGRPDLGSAYYYELSGDIRCRVVSDKRAGSYLGSAMDCNKIKSEVWEKELWEPDEGSRPEEKKWKAYLAAYKKTVEGQCFSLSVKVDKVDHKNKIAEITPDFSGMPDNDSAKSRKKITDARGSEVHFSLTLDAKKKCGQNHSKEIFGELESFNDGLMKIGLKEDFRPSLENVIKAEIAKGMLHPKISIADGKSIISSGNKNPAAKKENTDKKSELTDNTERVSNVNESGMTVEFVDVGGLPYNFYYDPEKTKLAFSCRAVKNECIWSINPDSIIPHQIMLFADFFGDFHQIKVMQRGLKAIKYRRDIWHVLSRKRVANIPEDKDVHWEGDCQLNDQQKDAVRKALGAKELCLIWGPPGTGKTEVIMEIARQEATRGKKTLITSQANLAVDNALARMHNKSGIWAFRAAKKGYKLEENDMSNVPMEATAGKFFSQWLQNQLCEKSKQSKNFRALREALFKSLKKSLESDAKPKREMEQMAELYCHRINVIGATLIGTDNIISNKGPNTEEKDKDTARNKICDKIGIEEFDTVIVDEVSKAIPPELFLPALLGKRLVLVGDHKQLPPMPKLFSDDCLSQEDWAKKAGVSPEELDIDSTLFERLWKKHDKDAAGVRAKLTVQYRMHEKIQHLINQFYTDSGEALTCGLSNKEMAEMVVASDGCLAGRHAVWVDTESSALERRVGTSYVNYNEIGIVGKLLEELPSDKELSVGVITFYSAQLEKLREKYEKKFSEKFHGKLIFGTVDQFQGRECDVVICSLVRNNEKNKVGFADKPNRINVAFSRARCLLCIVGNSGQFCYEGKSKESNVIYTKIYRACEELHESNFS